MSRRYCASRTLSLVVLLALLSLPCRSEDAPLEALGSEALRQNTRLNALRGAITGTTDEQARALLQREYDTYLGQLHQYAIGNFRHNLLAGVEEDGVLALLVARGQDAEIRGVADLLRARHFPRIRLWPRAALRSLVDGFLDVIERDGVFPVVLQRSTNDHSATTLFEQVFSPAVCGREDFLPVLLRAVNLRPVRTTPTSLPVVAVRLIYPGLLRILAATNDPSRPQEWLRPVFAAMMATPSHGQVDAVAQALEDPDGTFARMSGDAQAEAVTTGLRNENEQIRDLAVRLAQRLLVRFPGTHERVATEALRGGHPDAIGHLWPHLSPRQRQRAVSAMPAPYARTLRRDDRLPWEIRDLIRRLVPDSVTDWDCLWNTVTAGLARQ